MVSELSGVRRERGPERPDSGFMKQQINIEDDREVYRAGKWNRESGRTPLAIDSSTGSGKQHAGKYGRFDMVNE